MTSDRVNEASTVVRATVEPSARTTEAIDWVVDVSCQRSRVPLWSQRAVREIAAVVAEDIMGGHLTAAEQGTDLIRRVRGGG